MHDNGYLTDAEYETARDLAAPVGAGGDYEGFEVQLPPRDYFTDEIRRQLSRDFGEGEFFRRRPDGARDDGPRDAGGRAEALQGGARGL